MVGRPQENSVMTSTVTLQPLIANHATIPHMIAMNLPFHVRYSSLVYYKKLQSDRLFLPEVSTISLISAIPAPLVACRQNYLRIEECGSFLQHVQGDAGGLAPRLG